MRSTRPLRPCGEREEAIVEWHASVNSGDPERAAPAVGNPVVVLGPRGSAAITPAQRAEWLERSGIRLEPVGRHPAGERLTVVEQDATWPGSTGPTRVATAFRVDGGVLTAALRYPDLATTASRAVSCWSPRPCTLSNGVGTPQP